MAETKDKVITVESLSALHDYNKNTYMSTVNPTGSGTMTMNGGLITGSLMIGNNVKLVPTADALEIVFVNEEEIIEEG